MKHNAIVILSITFFVLLVGISFAAEVPSYSGYVNDFAGVLNNKNELEQQLTDLEKNTSIEVAVITISELPADESIETYSYKFLSTWGVGKKGEDNGLVFLLVANGTPGGRLRIEVGYGLESTITAGRAGRILDDALPTYEEGNYSEATGIVINELLPYLKDKQLAVQEDNMDNTLNIIVPVIMFSFFIIISIVSWWANKPRCPKCNSSSLSSVQGVTDMYVCNKCGKKFKKRYAHIIAGAVGGGFAGGGFGGGGGGGFGGGGGGGGGASR
jgi:uncharacterized protein